jgi:UDP-glucose 4-epimerase
MDLAMRILVTGGAGFIASVLAKRALAEGHEVTVVDNLSSGHRHNVPEGATFIHADLGNVSAYKKLEAERPEVIFHLAGQSSAWVSMDSAIADMDDNLRSTVLLSDWGLARGCTRFLYASTESVYGEGSARIAWTEASPTLPSSYYGCSKLASEHYLRVAARASGLEPTCLRLFTTNGPGQDLLNARQGILSIYLSYVLQGVTVPVKGPLDRVRDFVFMDDVVEAFLTAARSPRTIGKALNVATGVPTRLGELIDALGQAVAGKRPYPVQQEAGTPGDVMESFGDASQLTELTGWKPRVSLDEGIARIVARYRK